jgi:hypothetical protein
MCVYQIDLVYFAVCVHRGYLGANEFRGFKSRAFSRTRISVDDFFMPAPEIIKALRPDRDYFFLLALVCVHTRQGLF